MRVPVVAAIDALLVLLFVLIGRASHDEGGSLVGIAETAWPFLLALGVGWALTYVLSAIRAHDVHQAHPFAPARVFPAGIIVWVATVAVGMTARGLLTESGIKLSFVIVATVVLGIFLVGWRVLAARMVRRRARA